MPIGCGHESSPHIFGCVSRPKVESARCPRRYQVRLDAARTRDTQLLFVTTGILLRYMAGDALLSGFSHVIVDEVWLRVTVRVRVAGFGFELRPLPLSLA